MERGSGLAERLEEIKHPLASPSTPCVLVCLCYLPYQCGERYAWCEESQQCIMQRVRCSIMWGVGCGKSSYFCWQGNVCLPKSVPCNGYCTQYYKRVDQMSCAFDQDLLIREKEENKDSKPGGTLAPLVTIMLLVCAAIVLVLVSFRKHIMDQVERMRRKKPVEER